jgi:hypothetical protein
VRNVYVLGGETIVQIMRLKQSPTAWLSITRCINIAAARPSRFDGRFRLKLRERLRFVRASQRQIVFLELFLCVREMLYDLSGKDSDFLWRAVNKRNDKARPTTSNSPIQRCLGIGFKEAQGLRGIVVGLKEEAPFKVAGGL